MNKHFFILAVIFPFILFAQDSTGSLAFKKNRPGKQPVYFYQPDLSYRIWQQFSLIKEANSGNALAQHELGLRYLLGDDQQPDTVKAVYWIRKAALQKLPAAAFNYGILLYNGWGTQWNPFEAYKYFKIAADDGMAQANYVVGVLNTDNLVVKRDWGKAYFYLKKAADKGYRQASDIINHVKEQVPTGADTTGKSNLIHSSKDDKTQGLVFIDFGRPVTDPTEEISDSLLFEDLLLAQDKDFDSIIVMKDDKPVISFDRKDIPILVEAAAWGCPEALTLLGRFYQKGEIFDKDLVKAASFYIRGARMDSYRSTSLLFNLIKDQSFGEEVKKRVSTDDPEAMFVWYGLFDFNLDNSILEKDAVNMLVKSADKGYLPSEVELGLLLYTGKYFRKDPEQAINKWTIAAGKGSREALIRISASVIYNETEGDKNSALHTVIEGNENGSLLAEVVLGYNQENSGDKIKSSKDIIYYRSAAQRGNRYAFMQLRRKYDEIRPPDSEFKID